MAPPRRRPPPPAEARPGRAGPRVLGIAVAALVAGGVAAWLLLRDDPAPPVDAPPPAPPAVVAPRPPSSSEILDPAERRRVAELEELRGRYATLRDAFGGGQPASPASLERVVPVLRALFPPGTVEWVAACKGQLCRVDAPGPAGAWQARLAADPSVPRLAEGVVVDPDGKETAAYLVLLPPGAAPGGSVLDAVEEEFRTSTEIRECLSRVGATGRVEYVVTVDVSGYTYRQDTDLPSEAVDCADRVLGEILDRHPPPQAVQTASRTLILQR